MRLVFVALLICAFIPSAFAQEKRLDSSLPDFRAFFLKFKNSVNKSNKALIASLTVFPFKYGFDAGDEGTMTKTQFLKNCDKRLAKSLKEAVNEENPLFTESRNGLYILATQDAANLVFVRRGGSYKFSSYIVEP